VSTELPEREMSELGILEEGIWGKNRENEGWHPGKQWEQCRNLRAGFRDHRGPI